MRVSKHPQHLLAAFVAGAALVASATHPTPAFAQNTDTQAKAEEFYNKGDAAYNLGRFEEAIEWFTKAYESWPLAEFLYNIAQSYRQLGNCKQSLFFYKRFKSLKEKDKDNPLPKKALDEVNGFITDLEECVKKAKDIGDKDPNNTMGSGKTGGGDKTGGDKTGGDTGTDVAVVDDDVTDDEPDEIDDEEDLGIEDGTTTGAKLVSARVGMGATLIGAGDLNVPVQPTFLLTAGYPLAAGPVNLDVGLGFGYAPLPYKVGSMSESAALTQILLDVGATYPVNDKIGLRGDVGFGLMSLGTLVQGSPFTEGGAPTSGALSMPHFRLALAADYAITPNIVASLTPFSFAFSPAKEGLVMDSLTRIDFLLGVGYRM